MAGLGALASNLGSILETILGSWIDLGVDFGVHLRVDGMKMAILGDTLGGFGAILGASWTILEGLGGEKLCFSAGFEGFHFGSTLFRSGSTLKSNLALETDLEWILDLELDFEIDLEARMGLGSFQKSSGVAEAGKS